MLTCNLKGKLVAFGVCAAVYLGLYLISVTLLGKVYTFDYLAANLYYYNWIPVIVLIALNKTVVSYSITLGNLVGAIIGEVLGSGILNLRMNTLTPDSSVEEVYFKSTHYGAFIWLITLLAFIVVGIISEIVRRKRAGVSRA